MWNLPDPDFDHIEENVEVLVKLSLRELSSEPAKILDFDVSVRYYRYLHLCLLSCVCGGGWWWWRESGVFFSKVSEILKLQCSVLAVICVF